MHVSTIIVSYNTFDLTTTAIETALTSSPELEHEVIVVDNNSPDGSGKRLLELFPQHGKSPAGRQVRIIALDSNLGFAGANNVGASEATGDVLFFLNPDTETRPGAIAEIHHFITATPDAGAVGPYVQNPDGSDQESITWMISFKTLLKHYFPFNAFRSASLSRDAGIPAITSEVEIVKGCALAVRRDLFEKAGGWDDSYFLYAEEGELCYQLKKLGYKTYFLRTATIMHHGGASTGREDYAEQQILQQKSALQFIERHHSQVLKVGNRIMGMLGFGLRLLIFRTWLLFKHDSEMERRAKAASAIVKWFVKDYSSK